MGRNPVIVTARIRRYVSVSQESARFLVVLGAGLSEVGEAQAWETGFRRMG
jgi:hypothetical protein